MGNSISTPREQGPMSNLSPAEKAYIKEIAREVIRELPCKNNDERIKKCEQKLFNGMTTKINILFIVYGIILARLVAGFFLPI